MEVKAGYKQTEVGVIPEEWEVRTVADLCRITTGPFGTLLKAREYSGREGVPLVSVGEVRQGHFRITDDTPLVPESVVRRLPQYVLKTGDIVLGRKGAVDRSALVTENQNGWFLGSDGISCRPYGEHHAPYLAWQLQGRKVQSWLVQYAAGTTMPSLNQAILARVVVPYAPLPEQRAIAAALSDADALLDGLTRLIAKKRDLKQAAMQQLLTGQTRLPGFSGDWERVRLGSLFTFKNGLNKSKEFFGYGTPIVNYMDVFSRSRISAELLEGRVSLTQPELRNFDVRKGDVFFTRTSETAADVGMASVMVNAPIDTVFSGFVLRARPLNDRLTDSFKAYCFGSTFVRQQITSKASYTTRALTTGRALADVTLPLPTPAEQTAIAAVLSDMDAELESLGLRCEKARALKQAMMQELLTGKTRLVVPASIAAAGV